MSLNRLWDTIDGHMAVCPPSTPWHARQGQHWLTKLAVRCETSNPQGCPEVAAHAMLKLGSAATVSDGDVPAPGLFVRQATQRNGEGQLQPDAEPVVC
jgi:hypothetical protein